MVGARVSNLLVVRPELFGSSEKCFFRSFGRHSFTRGITPIGFMRSGRDGSDCNIIQKLRFRGPPCDRTGLIHIVENHILSITISLHDSSPACKGCISMRLSRSGRHRFFVPGKFTRNFDILSRRTIFRCGYSRCCTPRDRNTIV